MDTKHNSLEEFMWKTVPDIERPKIVYHYTSAETLHCFFKEDCDLYCTHYRTLNDDVEFNLGIRYAMDFIRRRLEHAHVSFIGESLERLMRGYIDRETQLIPWVVSFSMEPDSLPQWIGYTDKKNGGYAVGFDFLKLRDAASKVTDEADCEWTYLLPCLYIETDDSFKPFGNGLVINKAADEVLTFMLEPYLDKLSCIYCLDRSKERREILSRVCLFGSLVKQASFHFERECRLVKLTRFASDAYRDFELVGGKPRIRARIKDKLDPNLIASAVSRLITSPHGNHRVLDTLAQLLIVKSGHRIQIDRSKSTYNGY